MELTKKIFSLFICLILGFASLSFAFTNEAQATNNFGWSNITPGSPPLASNDGACAYNYGYNYAFDGFYLHGMTSFTDLVETKSDGSKVIHYFQFMPSCAYGFYSSTYRAWGAVVHWSSESGVWEKINPSFFNQYWTAYGGGFDVLDEPYIDSNGSLWSGRLFFHTNDTYVRTYRYTYTSYLRYYPGQTTVLRWDGGSNWTNIWDQSAIPNVVPGANGYNTSYSDWQGTQSGKYYIQSYNGSLYIIGWQGNNPTSTSSYHYWNLRIYKYSGSTNDLVNNPTPPKTWTRVWSQYYGQRYYRYGVPAIYDFRVLDDKFYISTSDYDTYPRDGFSSNGRWYVSTNNNPATIQAGATAGSSIKATCGTSLTYSNYRYIYFPITLNEGPNAGNTYTARVPWYLRQSIWYYYPWGGGSYLYYGYYLRYGSYYNGHFLGRRVKVSGTVNGSYFDITGMAGIYRYYSDSYIDTITTFLDGGPTPSCFESFKGKIYAGFYKNSDLLRVDTSSPYSEVSDLAQWQDCGVINDPNASPSRPMVGSILDIAKTTAADELGNPVDSKLYIGGTARLQTATSRGTCPLYSTEGEDVAEDPNLVPLEFTLEEDEWRLNKDSISPNFQNRMFGIYDIYASNLGLITQFGVYSIAPSNSYYQNHPIYKHRRFMVYNAPPSCDITQAPDPIVNERGTYTASMFTFSPTGGFGSGNVRVTLDLPENVYVPTEDGSGNPVNTEYFSIIAMNGGVLNLPIMIKSTNSATVNSYRDDPNVMIHIEDLTANVPAEAYVHLDVVPPKPGFSVLATPSLFTLIQGDCPGIECCEEHCKEITIDLQARNGFEDNVIVGTYWTDPPANQPEGVTFNWKKTTFVYDIFDVNGTGFTSLAEVKVRPEQGTRYLFNVKVSSNTLPGIYKFRIMFLSGAIKRQIDCKMTVLPPRPGIDVSPDNGTGTFNVEVFTKEVIPGGDVNYRLIIESKNGFVGKVALSLRGLPEQVYFNNPSGFEGIEAEIPIPGFALNYVDINPLLNAYANVMLKTTPYTINPYPPTNLKVVQATNNLNVVSWSASRRGSKNIAGYQVWRSLTKYIDAANLIATVATPSTSYEDADVEAGTPYYYFVRAYDSDTPPNYSVYATSGRIGNNTVVSIEETNTETTEISATADKMGTVPGFYSMQVIGNGVGFGPGNVPTNPTSITQLGLHVYRQDLNLKTPFLNVWGAIALLFGMMLVAWQFVIRKKEEDTF